MGGKCRNCGSIDNLERHHPYGRTWKKRSYNMLSKIKRYERDFNEGNLVLVCKKCHEELHKPIEERG